MWGLRRLPKTTPLSKTPPNIRDVPSHSYLQKKRHIVNCIEALGSEVQSQTFGTGQN